MGRAGPRPTTAITVRVTLKTAPLAQWRVAREMRERVKARFDHEGIELAVAHGRGGSVTAAGVGSQWRA